MLVPSSAIFCFFIHNLVPFNKINVTFDKETTVNLLLMAHPIPVSVHRNYAKFFYILSNNNFSTSLEQG